MKIHILGICGTFMAGVAQLARQSGHEVSGSDLNVYPPMSTQLAAQGIQLMTGFDPSHIDQTVDCVIVGNVISRGNPLMETILEKKIPYYSGPQWLAETILKDRWVLAVAGTHGKTTTTSLLAWMLDYVGLMPGFLVGGVPENFGVSARLGEQPYFVIEADEYDSAFFDKRSKFIHYHPQTLIMNNLEYDHADIFPDLDAVKKQFQYLVRTVPGNGLIIRQAQDENITSVLEQGCWTPTATFGLKGGDWQAKLQQADGSEFDVYFNNQLMGTVKWSLLGLHNVQNALAALAAAHHVQAPIEQAIESLGSFKNVKRRLEIKGQVNGVTLYDDFAHHPTAIATTLAGLRAKVGKQRMIVVLEFGSYTMRTGVHRERLQEALIDADLVMCKRPEADTWGLERALSGLHQPATLYDNVDALVAGLVEQAKKDDHIVIMSNSGFGGIHEKLLKAL
ncbi:MAG: UDP-N-acetylmuramate:L-alanyl-gamma-D-glutamyl-meso-diaminopimelate ligase [Gammaproteobacteria bacterium]|nr:UDP-N-acetylmuramate:L-alanyl-gamma-D-glutamyl-meso-diaminopimelate ligase [Gammaproteobacteria bacterium]